MAFQGFAKEEQFSTNQITIDINSVIDNDLAEANRQSKIRSRNSELADKWGTMYLNALISKHEVEKRNREENFKFFMDNREAIQKQEQYNWDVKKKDAERSHPYVPDLGDILGPALFKMAVNLGSHAIKKYGAEQKAKKAEAEEQKHKEAVGNWKNVLNQSNPEQLKILDGIDNFHGMVAEEQKRIEDEWRAAGDEGTGDIKSAQFASAMGMTSYLRETIAFSPDKVAIQYQNYSRNFETEINGRLYNQNDIIAGVNPATLNVYNARKQEGFGQSEGINLAERHGEAAGNIVDAMVQVDARYSRQSHNSSVRKAKDEKYELFTSNAERMLSQGRSMDEIYQHTFNPDDSTSPSYRMTMTETRDLWQSWADNGMFNAKQLGEFWRSNKIHGGKSLMEQHSQGNGTRASRAWKAAMDKVDLQNMKELQNSEAKHNALAKQTTNQALDGEFDQQTARNILEFFEGDQGKAILAKTSTTTTKNLISALSNTAGLTAQPKVVSDGWLHADKEYNKTTLEDIASTLIKTPDGKHLALSAYSADKLGLTNTRINNATKTWIAEVTDHLITKQGIHPKDPILKEKVLAIANDPQHEFTRNLAWQLTAETGPPGGGPEDMYEVPRFPNLAKPDGQGTTSIAAEYRSLKADKKGPLHWKDLRKIYNLPGYRDWVEQVDNATQLGSQHVQNVLSNPPPEVAAIITDQKHGSAWQAYMNALRYGGEDYADFKPLSGEDGLDYTETSQLNAQWGAQYANLANTTKKYINTQGFTPNASTNRIYEINSLAKSKAMGDSSSGPHLDIKKVGGGNFSLNDLDNYIVVHDSEFGDSPLSRLPVTDTYEGHVRRGSHGIDIGIYAGDKISLKNGAKVVSVKPSRHGDVVTIELPNGEQFEWRHGTFSQGQPQPQQQKPNKLDTPLTVQVPKSKDFELAQQFNEYQEGRGERPESLAPRQEYIEVPNYPDLRVIMKDGDPYMSYKHKGEWKETPANLENMERLRNVEGGSSSDKSWGRDRWKALTQVINNLEGGLW